MVDRFGRDITYLRISVTDRCNLRCHYCKVPGYEPLSRSETGFGAKSGAEAYDERSQDLLSFDEIVDVARTAAGMGIRKVRVTGGEPLLRTNIEELVRMLAQIDGVEDLAMSTNGILLADHAASLADAGLHRVNVSLDVLDPERYRIATGGGDVRRALAGIEAARHAGLDPVKLNCVVNSSSQEPGAREVARFARENGLEVRFIHKMDFAAGTFSVVEGGSGGDCGRCNRLRLSCDGQIRPCLFSDTALSIRELGVPLALERAIGCKPERGTACSRSWIGAIGG